MNKQEKLEIAHQLARLGVDMIEAGFPITSPGDFESVQAIAREVEGPVICGLARTSAQDIEAAWQAVKDSERPRIHMFLATSDIHIERKLQTTREDVKGQVRAAVAQAREYTDDVEFSPEDGSRSDVEYMAEVIQIALDEGATTINVPDTVGYTMPNEYAAMFTELYRLVPGLRDVVVSVHCHDDLGLAVANSLAGLEAGCRQVECAINGIGERAGNASLEEIVMLLHTREPSLGLWTGAETTEIARTSRLVSRLTGYQVQPNKAIVGRNAFAHEAGIHQDGVLKERTTYEIMDATTVGLRSNSIVLGKHSGRHALSKALEEMGFELDGAALNTAFKRFKEIADRKKQVTAMDLEALVTDELRVQGADYALESFEVDASSLRPPHARVVGDAARRLLGERLVHGRRSDRRGLPSDQRRHGHRAGAQRLHDRRGHRGPGCARGGVRGARGHRLHRRRTGRLDRHHRRGRACIRAGAVGRGRTLADRRRRRPARDRRGLRSFYEDLVGDQPPRRGRVLPSPACQSGKEVGDRDPPAGHRIAEVELSVGGDAYVAARSVHGGRTSGGIEYEQGRRAGGEPAKRLGLHLAEAVARGDDLDGEIGRPGPEPDGSTNSVRVRVGDERRVRCANGIRITRQHEPRLSAEGDTSPSSPHMEAQQHVGSGGHAAMLGAGGRHRSQLPLDELMAHAVVGEAPEILCARCDRMRCHARKASGVRGTRASAGRPGGAHGGGVRGFDRWVARVTLSASHSLGTQRAIRSSVIAYACMTTSAVALDTLPDHAAALSPAVIGARVKALRESAGLSLRDLSERSGVSAPMLSQVERGETSPTLTIAARIANGLELRLSQLLRLDEDGAVTIVRAGERTHGGNKRRGHGFEVLTSSQPGQRAELLPPHARARRRNRRGRRPADARAGQPRDSAR